jgi:exodeoxyribonuclease VII large subunit
MKNMVAENRIKLENISKKNIFKHPQSIYDFQRMNLDLLIGRFENSSKDILRANRNRLFMLENSPVLKDPQSITKDKKDRFVKSISKLEVLNPLLTLKRGYTIAKVDDNVISSSKDVKSGDNLDIKFDDGIVNTKVI